VKPAAFAYVKARALDEAIALVGSEPDARLLAGGQSLMPTLNMRLSHPKLLVDINGIGGLDGIAMKDGQVEIGALVRHAQAERSPEIARHAPLIAMAMPHIAHPAIRNRGTVGGSIALADPAAELPACLVALQGAALIAGANGSRRMINADDYFKGLFETALGADEILTAIRVPAATADMRYGFGEFARRHGDYALVGLAAAARATDRNLGDVRLVFFAIGTMPVRARKAEAALSAGSLDDAVKALSDDLDPPDDVQATGSVKKHLAGVLLQRVAKQLIGARA
jgi:carbon-monoxide dehydrogenase medium subunit